MSKKRHLWAGWLLAAGLSASGSATAAFTVDGNTLEFGDGDWYQVQVLTLGTYITICNGAASCTVASGNYIVINHDTGERWESVAVPAETDMHDESMSEEMPMSDEESTPEDGEMSEDSPGDEPADEDSGEGADGETPDSDDGADDGSADESLDISGSTLTFAGNDWYQVQQSEDYQTVCEGSSFCELAPGNYIVINHTSGMRWENVEIAADESPAADDDTDTTDPDTDSEGSMADDMSDPVEDSGSESVDTLMFDGAALRWPDDGWYQVQDASDFSTLCEGGQSCEVGPGNYIVINLTTGERWENFEVLADTDAELPDDADDGDSMSPDDSGDAGDEMAMEDSPADDEEMPAASPAPVVEGNMLVMGGSGWYQVQSVVDYSTICDGEMTCQVGRGIYNVVNHTTGERWEGIAVYDASGVWFGMTSYGTGEFLIDPDGTLYGLSQRDDGMVETVFGNVDAVVQRYIHINSRNPEHTTSFNLLGSRPTIFNSFDMDEVAYSLTVGSEGQQLTNSGIGGNFSLTYATADDMPAVSLESVAGSWEAKAAFCPSNCDITVNFDFGSSGFVGGSTVLNSDAPSQLAGSLATVAHSDQYLKIEFLLNGERRAGVVYRDRMSEGLILNTIGVGEMPADSFSAILQRL